MLGPGQNESTKYGPDPALQDGVAGRWFWTVNLSNSRASRAAKLFQPIWFPRTLLFIPLNPLLPLFTFETPGESSEPSREKTARFPKWTNAFNRYKEQ